MKILTSIILALLASFGLTYIFSYLVISHFNLDIKWYLGFFPLFYFILLCIDKITKTIIQSTFEKNRELVQIEKNKYQGVGELVCYKCRGHNTANILINSTSNAFKCSHCGTTNKVLIGFKCASTKEIATTIDMDSAILKGEIDVF